jgi:hypothetical protein
MRYNQRVKWEEELQTIFEGTLAKLGGFLFKFLDSTFVYTTTLVDQVSGSCGFSGIDVTDDFERGDQKV